MSSQEYIRSMVKGAEIYRNQGLLVEAKEKYLEAISFLSRYQGIPNLDHWKQTLETRLHNVNESLAGTEQADRAPDLDKEVQDLIKNLFSFSMAKEVAAFEGAVALWKFGQHRRALMEFENLLTKGIQPLVTAKHILLCHLSMSSPESAVTRFKEWSEAGLFSTSETDKLKKFLQASLKDYGMEVDLHMDSHRNWCSLEEDGAEPDISSVTIEFESGPLKGRNAELSITFQFGNILSAVLPSHLKDLVAVLKPGVKLPHMSFYSSMAFFRGRGTVSSRTIIKHGPRQGDYLLDITIEDN